VIYAVNQADGRLKTVGRQSSLGKTPREFLIDPTGKWLIVGNQDSDTFYVFGRDVGSGQLAANPRKVAVGKPVDFKLVPVQ
jgi:6-phosphogluconolactonase